MTYTEKPGRVGSLPVIEFQCQDKRSTQVSISTEFTDLYPDLNWKNFTGDWWAQLYKIRREKSAVEHLPGPTLTSGSVPSRTNAKLGHWGKGESLVQSCPQSRYWRGVNFRRFWKPGYARGLERFTRVRPSKQSVGFSAFEPGITLVKFCLGWRVWSLDPLGNVWEWPEPAVFWICSISVEDQFTKNIGENRGRCFCCPTDSPGLARNRTVSCVGRTPVHKVRGIVGVRPNMCVLCGTLRQASFWIQLMQVQRSQGQFTKQWLRCTTLKLQSGCSFLANGWPLLFGGTGCSRLFCSSSQHESHSRSITFELQTQWETCLLETPPRERSCLCKDVDSATP